MKYTLEEFLSLSEPEQQEYWDNICYLADEAHETWCEIAVEANTDTSIGSGRIPRTNVKCNCCSKNL